jgi:hypothetical protein
MRKFLSLTRQRYFTLLRKKSLRLIGTTSLLAGLIVIAAVFFHTSSEAVVPEAVLPRPEVVIAGQHIRFTLYPEGIHPQKATVHAGLVSIAIEDLTDANGGLLIERLTSGQRTPVGRVERLKRHWRGRSSVNLTPGTYRLRIAGREANEAELSVEP